LPSGIGQRRRRRRHWSRSTSGCCARGWHVPRPATRPRSRRKGKPNRGSDNSATAQVRNCRPIWPEGCGVRGPGADQVDLETSRCKQPRGLAIMDGHPASEDVDRTSPTGPRSARQISEELMMLRPSTFRSLMTGSSRSQGGLARVWATCSSGAPTTSSRCPQRAVTLGASTRCLSSLAASPASASSSAAASGWCRSNAGDSERIRGIDTKLCRGGGLDVAHSSDRPGPRVVDADRRRLDGAQSGLRPASREPAEVASAEKSRLALSAGPRRSPGRRFRRPETIPVPDAVDPFAKSRMEGFLLLSRCRPPRHSHASWADSTSSEQTSASRT
jgi:hypothetical protein